jgi:hypothetical protein
MRLKRTAQVRSDLKKNIFSLLPDRPLDSQQASPIVVRRLRFDVPEQRGIQLS